MLLGILDKGRRDRNLTQDLLQAITQLPQSRDDHQPRVWSNQHVAFCYVPSGIETLDEPDQPFSSLDQQVVAIFEGKVYNVSELKNSLGSDLRLRTNCSGELLAHLYDRNPNHFLDLVNGKFAFALWDERNQRLVLGRDRLGIQPLFYSDSGDRLFFCSSLRSLIATGWIEKQLNYDVVLEYLLYCYNPSDKTLLQNIYKLPAGHLLSVESTGTSLKRYWQLNFANPQVKTEAAYREEIPALIQDAVAIRMDRDHLPGVLLSGGIDSSTMVSLTSKLSPDPISTFSFRCEGRSYDESHYARLVAQQYGTHHTEVSYQPNDLHCIAKAVQGMDEPFCDIGIEIGTFLLGQAAQGQVSYVFSGEGGDELFGGHPVYTADKVATVIDRIPSAIVNPITQLLQQLPDSDQKKNLQVKLKRFAYSLSFPTDLLSHRWRVYYKPQELSQLCTSDFLSACHLDCIFDSMLKHTQDTDGLDCLSRSLYSDYWTLVSFYLRRLELLQAFGIENRLPLLDHRLVEYAAKIPSHLKIRGFSDTKYIYKQALVGVLPDEILFNRPKLGHSVPMKNWMREDALIQTWMEEILCKRTIESRGLFNADFIKRLLDEHLRKTHNHSHRLWSLLVLELWLRAHLD
jgi:asparagine synthase (glutamine-hydrolysing)